MINGNYKSFSTQDQKLIKCDSRDKHGWSSGIKHVKT